MDWDAGGIILPRGSLKARYRVVVGRASSDSQDYKYSSEPELQVNKKMNRYMENTLTYEKYSD